MFDYNSQVLFNFQSLSYKQEKSKQLTKITKHSHIVVMNAVCVCVREKEREREREKGRGRTINCTVVSVDAHFGKPSRRKKPSNMGRKELMSG